MIYQVDIDHLFNSTNEKDHAFAEIQLPHKKMNWDSVTGHLELESSSIYAKSESENINVHFYDSYDLESAVFKIETKDQKTEIEVSHNDLAILLDQTEQSFIGVLNLLVEKHFWKDEK